MIVIMMGKNQRIWMVVAWAVLVLAMVGIVATRATRATRSQPQQAAAPSGPLFAAPSFQLVDQDGQPFTSDDLRGKVWIADFIFTHCAGPCPMMSGRMADVQKALGSSDVKLVSFSVDPERDTSQVLKEYAQRFSADDARWKFLTGTKQQITDVAKGMNVSAKDDPKEGITHSTLFLLVDRSGQVVRLYHNEDEQEMKRLAADADQLAEISAGQGQ
jgi:protein SCO1/2